LIQDKTPRNERVPAEKRHPNGVIGIGTLTVAVEDVSAPQHWMSSVLGHESREARREDIGARGARFLAGPHALEFVAPGQASSPLSDWLRAHGAGTWSVTLKTSGNSRALDERKAGARISR
jgi:hypothetical protein